MLKYHSEVKTSPTAILKTNMRERLSWHLIIINSQHMWGKGQGDILCALQQT